MARGSDDYCFVSPGNRSLMVGDKLDVMDTRFVDDTAKKVFHPFVVIQIGYYVGHLLALCKRLPDLVIEEHVPVYDDLGFESFEPKIAPPRVPVFAMAKNGKMARCS